ncbi:uncharacterized protein CMU_020680 [Cryptosporidium muris RN66]|uniref:C2 NT-type domain-containing protein n=1 Tax=Cryptosporidium muris (strain RN66) TaxID=441375 RepID=B6AJ87_CRYMR|nr:uncharacterized protein CMU_020680 [Cryptosporidium muris RN66]EEA08324.1 hypothetical protein, conserved [Cryptosporidium muris RN66]|eukprot:XP_002142673.1 hypothetical protein [Cryptosporidium muris RN66]
MRIIRAAKHIRHYGEKFRYELRVENISVILLEECEIKIDWIRGPKRTSGKESVLCVNGSTIHPFYESLVLIVTLFRNLPQKSGRLTSKGSDEYLPKDSRLIIYAKYKDNPIAVVIGEVPLELSSFVNNYKGLDSKLISPTRVEIPLIKCSDPNAYIEFYINCISLGQISNDFDDTASMMSGFTTVTNETLLIGTLNVPDTGNTTIQTENFKPSKYILTTNSISKNSSSNIITEVKESINESALGIPMFSIKEETEIENHLNKETEERTETESIINENDVICKFQAQPMIMYKTTQPYYSNPVINSNNIMNTSINQDMRNPNIINNLNSYNDPNIISKGIDININSATNSSPSSKELLIQRLQMEQEEYKRKLEECNMEINSLNYQLQIYIEQEKSWKQRESDLMKEIQQLRVETNLGNELYKSKSEILGDIQNFDSKNQKFVNLNDYCLLQQEVSELTAIRDELRRLREADKYVYERHIKQLENQMEDLLKQLSQIQQIQKSDHIQDEVEAEFFSQNGNSSFFATATSQTIDYNTGGTNYCESSQTNFLGKKSNIIVDNKLFDITNDNDQYCKSIDTSKNKYEIDEIEKELIKTKLTLAQTETAYQVEINNLKTKLEKQRKQLLAYSLYVGNLEVINANLKYGTNSIISSNQSIENNYDQSIESNYNINENHKKGKISSNYRIKSNYSLYSYLKNMKFRLK